MSGLTLDAGGLIAIDRSDRRAIALLEEAQVHGARITIPAPALAQAIRAPARQARLMKLCRQRGTDIVPLNRPDALAVGVLLAESRTTDIADAHVVICARRAQQAVLTSDPEDIARLDPSIRTVGV